MVFEAGDIKRFVALILNAEFAHLTLAEFHVAELGAVATTGRVVDRHIIVIFDLNPGSASGAPALELDFGVGTSRA